MNSPRLLSLETLAKSCAILAARDPDLARIHAKLGKFSESIPSLQTADALRQEWIEKLQRNLADTSPAIRAKAIRSLGKLAKHGHLAQPERETLKEICQRLMGTDERFEWDHAYIVRREAEEALQYVA